MAPSVTIRSRSRAPRSSSLPLSSSSLSSLPSQHVSFPNTRLLTRVLVVLGTVMVVVNLYVLWPNRPGSPSNSTSSNRSPTRESHLASPPKGQLLSKQQYDSSSRKIIDTFQEAGVELDEATLEELPKWDEIVALLGEDAPRIYGLDHCQEFRNAIPAVERNLGAAGMFNTGTNLMTQLLKNNCKIPERVAQYGKNATKEAHGIRWQVPWGKHMPASHKWDHATKWAQTIDKESVLPVVTIRDPYNWMTSMCKNGYTARWPHSRICPHLVEQEEEEEEEGGEREFVPLQVSFDGKLEQHKSLAHLWNDWYDLYFRQAEYPFVMVRFEDLIFHPKEATRLICECAGGEIQTDRPFQYIVDSAKDGPGHGKVSERTGMVKAWIQYGKPKKAMAGFSPQDYQAAKDILDPELFQLFGYQHPPAA